MSIIHAYRRTKLYTYVIPALGVTLEFKPNELGDVVCSVDNEAAEAKLLSVPTGFRVYPEPLAKPKSPLLNQQAAGSEPDYVLKSGDIEVDLRTMTDETLREFAAANGIAVHHAAKGDTIRDKIVAAMKAEG